MNDSPKTPSPISTEGMKRRDFLKALSASGLAVGFGLHGIPAFAEAIRLTGGARRLLPGHFGARLGADLTAGR